MAEWECEIQLAEGILPTLAWTGPTLRWSSTPGRWIFGLLAAHNAGGDGRFVDAARRAAAWLAAVQERDGSWRRFDYRDTVHVYNTRTAWALDRARAERPGRDGPRGGRAAPRLGVGPAGAGRLVSECRIRARRGPIPPHHRLIRPRACSRPASGSIAPTMWLAAELRLPRPSPARGGRWIHRRNVRLRLAPHCPLLVPDRQCPDGGPVASADERHRRCRLSGSGRARLDPAQAEPGLRRREPDVRGPSRARTRSWGRYLFGTFPNWATKFFMDALLMEELVVAGRKSCIRCW